MPNFGYNQLQEEGTSPAVDQYSDNLKSSTTSTALTSRTSAALTSRTNLDSLQASEEPENGFLRTDSDHDPSSNSENVRYTALRPTSVRELRGNETEVEGADPEGTDSSILVTIAPDKRKSIPKIYAVICCLLIACSILLAFGLIYVFVILPAYKKTSSHPDPRVESEVTMKNFDECLAKTSCGTVKGTKEEATCVFRGIPYAVPPTGALRWKPPSGCSTSGKGIYSAVNYGSKCLQPSFGDNSTVEGSEDCLYVNVWTPAVSPGSSLPVMVWFHSGDFVYGSGHLPGMSPTSETASATNSVFVSFNYRLGVFGFLAVDKLREEADGAAGNYGFMDQQLVLKWVKTNIRQFGGNENLESLKATRSIDNLADIVNQERKKKNLEISQMTQAEETMGQVTIFGHGSGATSVHAMLLSPGSKGLFHSAWLTSPVAVLNKTVEDACRDNKSFLKSSGCSNVQCLRQLPADQVLRSSPWQLQPHWSLEQLFGTPKTSQIRNDLPIFDGHVVHLSSMKTKHEGPVVPVIFGSSYFDLSSLETIQAVVNLTWEEYQELMNHHVGGLNPDAVTRANYLYSYRHHPDYAIPDNFPSIPSVQFLHLLGDIKSVCPVKILTDDFVSLYPISSPVYMYVAEVYPSSSFKLASREKNAFVGWDIAAFFNTFQELDYAVGQGELNFQNIIRQEVMSFVRSGQPDALRWKTADLNVGVIGRDVTVTPVTSEYFSQCDLWKQNGFFKYSWS